MTNEQKIVSAVFDADSWVLLDKEGEPVEWPETWPELIDNDFLESKGIVIGV